MIDRKNEPCSKADPPPRPRSLASFPTAARWLDRIDPGAHRRIKGLRLVTAFGIAAMLGTRAEIVRGLPDGEALNSLAGIRALGQGAGRSRHARRV
jgi:hypothetical protein